MGSKLNKVFTAIFLNENGKLSMTVIFAILAFIIVLTIFVRGLIFGQDLSNSWLTWSIEIGAIAIGVRAGQRGFQYIGEGMAGLGKKSTKMPEALPSENIRVPQPQQIIHKQIGFFNTSDFDSKDGAAMPVHVYNNILLLIDQLNVLRAEIGVPIIITSGYRSEKHNAKIGGKINSQHLRGNAADFKVLGREPDEVVLVIGRLKREGKMLPGGLKAYDTFTHYDIRGVDITW